LTIELALKLEIRIKNIGYAAFMALMSSPLSAVLASVPREALAKDTVQQKSLSAFQSTNQSQAELVASSAGIQAASDRPNGDPIGEGSDQLYSQQLEQRLAKE